MEITTRHLILYLVFIATIAKITLFMYIFSSLYLLYENKKISLKPILFGSIFLIALVPIMYLLRSGSDQETDTELVANLIIIYMISSIVAFGNITPCSSFQWGETSLRFFIHFFIY